jgi:DNA-binding MarR family transcriptional regulator
MSAAKRPPARKQSATRRPAAQPAAQASVRVLRRFRLVFNAVKTHFRELEKQSGVAGAQLWALSIIQERPGVGVTELARSMDVHQSTASNLVRGLLEQQLVLAKKKGADRRTVQLHVMAAGGRALRRAPGPFAGVLPTALASLDASTLARLDRDLGKLISALGADERGAHILIVDR